MDQLLDKITLDDLVKSEKESGKVLAQILERNKAELLDYNKYNLTNETYPPVFLVLVGLILSFIPILPDRTRFPDILFLVWLTSPASYAVSCS